jgi:hypothetical protein
VHGLGESEADDLPAGTSTHAGLRAIAAVIQFMPTTAATLGTTCAALAAHDGR